MRIGIMIKNLKIQRIHDSGTYLKYISNYFLLRSNKSIKVSGINSGHSLFIRFQRN